MQITKARRSAAKIKIGISSPSGFGKTYSALLLAKGLVGTWDKVCVIDTENGSASLYDNLGGYSTLELEPPYHPNRFIEAIELAYKEGFECIIIDSSTAEWTGKGGCLELHEQFGGQWKDWAKVTPLHKSYIDTILHTPVHVIVCNRTKTEWATEQNAKGKTAPKKVGLKAETRDGMEYEVTVSFRLDENHYVHTEKDRTGLFPNTEPFVITEKTGEKIKDWCAGALDPLYVGTEIQKAALMKMLAEEEVDAMKYGKVYHEFLLNKPFTKAEFLKCEVESEGV